MNVILTQLEQRWTAIFSALAAGDDVPPSLRLRTEGLMEAALLVEAATATGIDGAMEDCYRRAFGRPIAGDFGEDWRNFFPFPQIPAMGPRAPVYPGTRD